MAIISKPKTFAANAVAVAADVNSDFDTIYNDYNGNITTANLSPSAAIKDTQLETISTGAKVNISALTATSQAAGDLLYASNASSYARLPKGTVGQVLTMGASLPEWGTSALTGQILMWSGTIASIPSGYLFCNGATVSQTTYASLYAVIGHQYASDPGGGNFTLPDMRNYYPVGAKQDDSGVAKSDANLTASGAVLAKTRANNNKFGMHGNGEYASGGFHHTDQWTDLNGVNCSTTGYIDETGNYSYTVAFPNYVALAFIIKY